MTNGIRLLISSAREQLKRTASTVPLYRAIPPSPLRRYAALHYHADTSPESICSFVDKSGEVPAHFFSAGWIVAQSAFAIGRDDLARRALDAITARFPDVGDVYELEARLLWFHGDHEGATNRAFHARLVAPDSEQAASTAVRVGSLTLDRAAVDAMAAEATHRFPDSAPVLWASAKACRTEEQFHRLVAARRQGVADRQQDEHYRPKHHVTIRPFSLAAARLGLVHTAVEIYAEGMLDHLRGFAPMRRVPRKQLLGKDPLKALRDICEVFERAGIPFFFAAGTALGLVREGRPLSHDADIDVGVMNNDWAPEAIFKAFSAHPMFITEPVHPRTGKIGLKHRSGTPVDVFRFYEEGGRLWHRGTFVRWHNSPFEVAPRPIEDLGDVPLPRDEDRYLTENYRNWRIPNPDFDAFTDAPNVEITWPEYFDLHRVRRGYRFLSIGQARAALKDLNSAASTLVSSSAGAQLLEVLR